MIIPPSVESKVANEERYVHEVAGYVKDRISSFCEERGYAYLGRTKTAGSLAEKLETGRFARWSDVDDLFACAIVVPSLQHEADAIEFLDNSFIRVRCQPRGATKKDPSVFRFDSTRYIGKIRPAPGMEPTKPQSIPFEVQIRTAFEHAWSVTTHAVAYKGAETRWRNKRLAAQLRAAVEQLDQVVLGFDRWADIIQEQQWGEVDDHNAIMAFMQTNVAQGLIPSEAAPGSWGRFAENLRALIVLMEPRNKRDHTAAQRVKEALDILGEELASLGGYKFPRSLSLYQFCLGALCKYGFFKADLPTGFTTVVTTELTDFYPEVGDRVKHQFDFDA